MKLAKSIRWRFEYIFGKNGTRENREQLSHSDFDLYLLEREISCVTFSCLMNNKSKKKRELKVKFLNIFKINQHYFI